MNEWPADQVERWPIKRLIPYARNARTHTDEQVALLAASIREWGWTMPVLVDETGNLIAGHGRVLAARQLGLTDIPTMMARGWSDAQIRAYRLADNQLAQRAGWDDELLHLELGDLKLGGYDLGLIGFGEAELDALLADRSEGLTDPDEVPPIPIEPVSRLGDLWLLGAHRLLCGDATVEADVKRVLDGVKPHLMVTDPPYGVEYDAKWRQRLPFGVKSTAYIQAKNDQESAWTSAYKFFNGDVVYIWHASIRAVDVALGLAELGYDIKAQIIWVKESASLKMGKGYSFGHEPCWYAVKKGRTQHWRGAAYETTVWRVNRRDGLERTGHAAQKPVECMRRPIENNSSPGQAVYEPFSGSGTTIIAAEMTGRACLAMDIMPAFIDMAVLRWQNFTGKQATREHDGAAFDDVSRET